MISRSSILEHQQVISCQIQKRVLNRSIITHRNKKLQLCSCILIQNSRSRVILNSSWYNIILRNESINSLIGMKTKSTTILESWKEGTKGKKRESMLIKSEDNRCEKDIQLLDFAKGHRCSFASQYILYLRECNKYYAVYLPEGRKERQLVQQQDCECRVEEEEGKRVRSGSRRKTKEKTGE